MSEEAIEQAIEQSIQDAAQVLSEEPAAEPKAAEAPEAEQPDTMGKDNSDYLSQMSADVIETRARELGWKPTGKKSAREWIENSVKYVMSNKDTMEGLSNQVKNLQDTMQQQVEQARKEERALNQNMIESLKSKIEEKNVLLDVAVEDGDKQAHRLHLKEQKKLEKELNQAEQKAKEPDVAQAEQQQQRNTQIAQDFVAKNEWYMKDEFLHVEMRKAVAEYEGAGMPFEKALKFGEKKLRRLFKDDFAQYEAPKPTPPAGNQLETKEPKANSKPGTKDGLSNAGRATYKSQMDMFKEMSPAATDKELKTFEQGVMKILKEDPTNFKRGG
jgi:hypothetical protein